jgi:hypothetical protein
MIHSSLRYIRQRKTRTTDAGQVTWEFSTKVKPGKYTGGNNREEQKAVEIKSMCQSKTLAGAGNIKRVTTLYLLSKLQ